MTSDELQELHARAEYLRSVAANAAEPMLVHPGFFVELPDALAIALDADGLAPLTTEERDARGIPRDRT